MNKKFIIFIVSLFLVVALLITMYSIDQYNKKKIFEFKERADLIKIGMSTNEVIKIMGKPNDQGWVSNEFLKSKKLKEKYKKAYILVFCPDTILEQKCGIGLNVYFDINDGNVIEIHLSIA